MLQKWFWEGLGLHLGGVWASLGRLVGALGGFLAVFWAFKFKLCARIAPTWAPRGLLDRFWHHLGGSWEGFERILALFERDFGGFLHKFYMIGRTPLNSTGYLTVPPFWENLKQVFARVYSTFPSLLYVRTPALPRFASRSVTMRGGSRPPCVR